MLFESIPAHHRVNSPGQRWKKYKKLVKKIIDNGFRVFAFVEFSFPSEASAIIRAFEGFMFRNRQMRVMAAKKTPYGQRNAENNKRLKRSQFLAAGNVEVNIPSPILPMDGSPGF